MKETNENRELRTQLQHIADGGHRCPRCNSEYIEDTLGRDSIDNYYYRDFECLDCGFQYTEEYILNGYWPKGDDDPQIGSTLVEHLRQQLRWARKTIAKLREDKGDASRWDWGKRRTNEMRTIYALMGAGYTTEEAVALVKAASKDEEGGGLVYKATTVFDEKGEEI